MNAFTSTFGLTFYRGMPRNIEIKARISDISELHQLAKELSGSEGVKLYQNDTFFNSVHGRLKMRSIEVSIIIEVINIVIIIKS